MRDIDKIIIHCLETPEGRKTTLEEVTLWHRKRGFRTIGYHYLIHLNGEVSRGRKENETGAHCRGQNGNSIGIAYVGGVDKDFKPKDTRTHEQRLAFVMLIESLRDKYPGVTVHGHYEFSSKTCPSFKIDDL